MKPLPSPSRWQSLLCTCLLPLLLWLPAAVHAEGDPPGRVGRLADLQGKVSVFEPDRGAWAPAQRNRPLTAGDRVSTEADARAELRVGSTVLRLAGGSELEVLQLDDQRLQFQLHAGSLALRVRSREVAAEIQIVTTEVRLRPLRSGSYRVDRQDDATFAGSQRGDLQIDGADGFTIETGRRVELWREGAGGAGRELRHAWVNPPADAFAAWVAGADRDDERSAASRYVSPEMTGVEDLDRHGSWDRHPEHGSVWVPYGVSAGWAPYRHGSWVYLRPWGWTWVDDAPWGFAPFHYGRWVHWGGRWGWAPGAYVARPVYAPALVAWIGGSPGVTVSIGGPLFPRVGWVPLAPREIFVPYYVVTPIYLDRINPHQHLPGRPRPPVQVPTGPVVYGNQSVPGAVTVAPRDRFLNRRPVVPEAIDRHDGPAREPAQRPRQPGLAPPPAPPVRALAPASLPPSGRELPSAGEVRLEPPAAIRNPPAAVAVAGHPAPAVAVTGQPTTMPAPQAPVMPPARPSVTAPATPPPTPPVPAPAPPAATLQPQPPTRPAPTAERPPRPSAERDGPPRGEDRARASEGGGNARARQNLP